MKTIKRILVVFVAILSISTVRAQEEEKSKATFDIGVDYASRYVWRGGSYSDSPVLQPYAELASGNFTFGVWASYETGGEVVGQEFDFYASYSFGAISVGFTDYAFPTDANSDGYFMMKNHIGEASLSFDGVDSFPVSLAVFANVYNDDDNSIYTELGVPFKIGGTEMGAFVGGGNEIYTTDGDFALTNVGVSASKDVKITDAFSLGVSAAAIFNPDSDDAYLVFILSL